MTTRYPPSPCPDCIADVHRWSSARPEDFTPGQGRWVRLLRRTCLCPCRCRQGTVDVQPGTGYGDPDRPTAAETTLPLPSPHPRTTTKDLLDQVLDHPQQVDTPYPTNHDYEQ